jgi:hypothetical protein
MPSCFIQYQEAYTRALSDTISIMDSTTRCWASVRIISEPLDSVDALIERFVFSDMLVAEFELQLRQLMPSA